MENNKKGVGRTPTPRGKTSNKNTSNYIRGQRLCPSILIIATISFLVAYHYQASNAIYLCAGILITDCLFGMVVFPIEDEEDDDEYDC